MKIKDFLSAANRIDKIEHNIIINNSNHDVLTIKYSLIFNKVNVRINLLNQDCFFELKLNDKGELELDLTDDNKLISKITPKIYYDIINKIFNEEI
jgi:hypothetical protein